ALLHCARDKNVPLVASQPPDRGDEHLMRAYKSWTIEERSKTVECPAMQTEVDGQIELLFTACSSPVAAKHLCRRPRPTRIREGKTIFVAGRRPDRTCKLTRRRADQ